MKPKVNSIVQILLAGDAHDKAGLVRLRKRMRKYVGRTE